MSDPIPVKRALLSVFDKTGLVEFAKALQQEFGVQLISTGGTARALRDAGLAVRDISDVTGFPEMMDGRIKTLHPKVHGGLLSVRENPEHVRAMQTHGIEPIDLVCINLYPFEKTIAKPGVTLEEAIENIDIGGPSMVRSAAKNHRYVLVVTSPADYDAVLADLRQNKGASSDAIRRKHAQQAFARTSAYDGAIAGYLAGASRGDVLAQPLSGGLPDEMSLHLQKKQDLRYGENPHQKGAVYVEAGAAGRTEASVAFARQLHGMELSYINLLDADGALAAVKEFTQPAACIVKHTTPCGCAVGADLATAFRRAFEGDPLAAFGGIVALNGVVDLPAAEAITGIKNLLHVIVAVDYQADALELLRQRWKNVRLLAVGPLGQRQPGELNMHKIAGGYLLQERDLLGEDAAHWTVASRRQPTATEMADLTFAWLVCKHVKSNAIVVAGGQMLLGAGAGQMDRVAAAQLAVGKAGGRARGAGAASDAYFPFPDGPQVLLDAGVTAIIQPGGSVKDQEVIDLINQRGAAMVFTGQRHFKH